MPKSTPTLSPKPPTFEACALTHQGKVREYHEDAFVLGNHVQPAPAAGPVVIEKILQADGGIAAVIDGMGGMGGGDVAATWLARRWAKRRVRSAATLTRQLCADHDELLDEARYSPTPLMGAVATGVALLPKHALLFHAGDCRAYRVKGNTCTLLTKDDTSSTGAVLQAFGGGEYTGMKSELHPHLSTLPYDPEATLLLMSDGAWQYLKPPIIVLTLSARPSLREFVLTLAAFVLEGRAGDNLTLIAIRQLPT